MASAEFWRAHAHTRSFATMTRHRSMSKGEAFSNCSKKVRNLESFRYVAPPYRDSEKQVKQAMQSAKQINQTNQSATPIAMAVAESWSPFTGFGRSVARRFGLKWDTWTLQQF